MRISRHEANQFILLTQLMPPSVFLSGADGRDAMIAEINRSMIEPDDEIPFAAAPASAGDAVRYRREASLQSALDFAKAHGMIDSADVVRMAREFEAYLAGEKAVTP